MTKRRKKKVQETPTTPLKRGGFRDPDYVQSVVLRMGTEFIDRLDELCDANARSRREIIEILISEASMEYRGNKEARINPL
jgi:gamma-glutamylcyclotransferase (GGCT)/AIG2-like uncharacterized protein YtfP